MTDSNQSNKQGDPDVVAVTPPPRSVEPITPEEMSSGAWLDEPSTTAVTGLGSRALEGRRKRGTLTYKPRYLSKRGGREYWYLRAELEHLRPPDTVGRRAVVEGQQSGSSASDAGRFGADLELLMARAEAREAELELLRHQLRSARNESRRLRSLLATQLSALTEFVTTDTSDIHHDDA